jgi:hypothetical protein
MSRFCATKLSPTLVFIGFLGNEEKIPKTASYYNLWGFVFVCAAGISGAISPCSLSWIGPSTSPNQSYRRGAQLWYFGIWVRLSLWICIGTSCCSGLREHLSGWVDLVGKPPSPRSFTCWCFGPWVIGVLFTSCLDLWRTSWSSHKALYELYPKVLL